jgi:carboxypeptidase Taq
MNQQYHQLKTLMQEIWDLSRAQAVLNWDRQTKMPPKGAPARTRQVSTLSRLIHERSTSEEVGRLLEDLLPWQDELDFDSDEAALIRLAYREYIRQTAVPTELVIEQAKAGGEANVAWMIARQENDFESFIPHLEIMFDLARRYTDCFSKVEHPYDALLEKFEPGMTVETVSRIFNEVKGPQSELIQAIAGSGVQIDDSLLHQHFPQAAQLDAALDAVQILGYDLERGRLDLTTHPFATSFSVDDVRITTRVYEDFLNACLFASMHEAGHALFELGVSPRLEGLPLARGASSGVHESQSRLFENLIGRSQAFSSHLFPILQKHFPTQLGDADVDTYYRAINKVKPSFIRVEADEISYNLHIILRFEIELGVLNDEIPIKELPEAWNEKFKTYLGVVPPTDTVGVLQDVHWSWGLIGHFTSYAMGNIIASQWWHQMGKDIPNQDDLMAEGNITPIRAWLVDNVHQHGKKYLPIELIERVTGGPIDTGPYLTYLRSKYGEIYKLENV